MGSCRLKSRTDGVEETCGGCCWSAAPPTAAARNVRRFMAAIILVFLLPVNRERQQNIAGDPTASRIAGIHEEHSTRDCRAGAVQRTTPRGNAVYGVVRTNSVEVPDDFAVGCGIG